MKALLLSLLIAISSCIPYYPDETWPGRYTHEFLAWCIPEGDGIWEVWEDYPHGCPVERVSRGQWDVNRLPLTVNGEMPLHGEAQLAVIHWNRALGFEMFRWDEKNMDPDIAFVTAGFHPRVVAEAKRLTYKGKHYGLILYHNQWWMRDDRKVAIHELGHLLGLRHDPSPDSIMYQGDENEGANIQASDINALRWLYKTPLRTRQNGF